MIRLRRIFQSWHSSQRLFVIGMIVVLVVSLLPIHGYGSAVHAEAAAPTSPLASDLDASFAIDWIQAFYDNVKTETVDAPGAARVYAYAGVTLYQSVVDGIPGDVSLATQIKGMPVLPPLEPGAVYDWSSVANAALQVVADSLMPAAASQQAFATLYSKQVAVRQAAVGNPIVQRSLTRGQTIGQAIAAWAAQDGAAEAYAKAKTYKLPTGNQWDYVITTPGTRPVGPYWGTLRSFSLSSNDVCFMPLKLELSSDPSSTLYKQAMEVKTIGDHLTTEQKAIADWWVDTPGLTGAPAGHWMIIANQMVSGLKLKLDRAAELYAMIGMTLEDAFIACWQTKYTYPYIRPITYINRYINPNWKSYIVSPPFPTYPSGHSTASEAAASVFTALLGEIAFTDTTHVKEDQPARSYTSFESAASEAAISRLYGGIHFRMDVEEGMNQGRCVAQQMLKTIHLHAAPAGN